jgi:retinol dehydrogenase-12
MMSRYPVSKLLNLFFARELASRLPQDSPLVINAVNPGFCISGLRRSVPWSRVIFYWFLETLASWSTERGSRQLIFAALGNQDKLDETKGAYISSSKIEEPSDYVISDEGAKVQKQLWVRPFEQVHPSLPDLTAIQHETLTVLSKVSPNVQPILNSNNLL